MIKNDSQNEAATLVAEFIRENEQTIVEAWRSAAAADQCLQSSKSLTREDFVDHVPAALEALCNSLTAPGDKQKSELIREEIIPHGHHRWKQGYNLEELIRDWGLLSQVLLKVFQETREQGQDSWNRDLHGECSRIMLEFISDATTFSVQEYERMKKAEARSLQADLEQARQEFEAILEARGTMLREAAHDLRGSLSGISNASAVMQRLDAADENLRGEAQKLLDSSIGNVKSMLDDLLDLSRLEANCQHKKVEPVDVAKILGEAIQSLQAPAREAGLELRFDGPDSLTADTDSTALRRILQNLVLNGLKYTEEGHVAVSYQALDEDNWQLTVEDTGPGLQHLDGTPIARELDRPLEHSSRPTPEEDKPEEAYEGEGIGLTIVKRLCELLDASIRYESQPGKGAVFILEFPRHYPES
jgi:signal transduction histidine kinase